DEIGQALTGLKLTLHGLDRLPALTASARLLEVGSIVDDLLTRIRKIALDLRPAMLDDLGLLPALLWMFKRCSRQMGTDVCFEHNGLDRRFTPDLETAVYRIIQEALTNVSRHAGVNEASVRVWVDEGTLRLQVTDEGKGFDPDRASAAAASSGLASMHERARLHGGQLTVDSSPGSGSCVSAAFALGSGMCAGEPDSCAGT
ncbi:MAG: sensor histidine kinase, partial [Candidatus Binatia bacterium]